ncbi:MAG TPA: alpha/beta hydrolase [Acetobacteraceae bacterium]|jgi:non-heme chloroperoxidase|nr:alpha/beta hydrolase [Acetobacteraceae bacterium]
MRWLWTITLLLVGLLVGLAAPGAPSAQTVLGATMIPGATSHFFTTSDDVQLHYFEAGPRTAHTIVFVPGWTMPAWIWQAQITAFSQTYHVIAFDPRGQGDSEIAPSGYDPERRGRDIGELLIHLGPAPALVVGWSLGVLDTLAEIHVEGDAHLAGLVLVDNSVGEEPPPLPRKPSPKPRGRPQAHANFMHDFILGMFRTPQSPAYIDRLTEVALHTPEPAARALLSYPVPRSYWREAVYATRVPVLYVVRPGLSGQAANLQRNRPDTETAVFSDAGHALFVDDAARFNALMQGFIYRHVWP